MTDSARLREAIRRSGLKYAYIAQCLGLSAYGLQRKIDNRSEFRVSKIIRLSELLGLPEQERSEIFLLPVVIFNHRKGD